MPDAALDGCDGAGVTDWPEPLEAVALGFVLRVLNFRACTAFYSEALEMPILFREERKVCLRLGHAYLMLIADTSPPDPSGNPILRLSVPDVAVTAGRLSMRNVPVDLAHTEAGLIATFRDPDGNPCELRKAEDGFLETHRA